MKVSLSLLLLNACVFMSTCSNMPTGLEQVQQSGELRVVTRNASTTYYLGANGQTGLEYDLALGFAEYLGVKLRIYDAEEFSEILGDVGDWRADMAAAGLTITASREAQFAFSEPYQHVNQVLVYRMSKTRPKSIEDVIGAQLTVTGGSSFVETLMGLQLTHPNLSWTEAPAASSVEELLRKVAKKELDYTVVDSTDLEINRKFFPALRIGFELSHQEPLGWAFRRQPDTSLRDAANDYLQTIQASEHLDNLKAKYFNQDNNLDYVGTRQFIRHVNKRLLKYRRTFQQAGEQNDLDWQLLAAMSYQESHWNPNAVSPTGVRGLMMLTKATARQMGVKDRTDPRESIMGGARYFARLHKKLPDRITEPDRTWFALAAYNIGFLHLEDARILTQRQGLNPDLWEDVRKHLPLLAQQQWFSQTKRGYARGWEPVIYVKNIRSYRGILEWAMSDRNPSAQWFDQIDREVRPNSSAAGGDISALP